MLLDQRMNIKKKYQTGLVVALKIDPCPPGGQAMWQCVLSKSKRPVLKQWNLSCFNPSLLTTLQTIYPRFFVQPFVIVISLMISTMVKTPVETTTRRPKRFSWGTIWSPPSSWLGVGIVPPGHVMQYKINMWIGGSNFNSKLSFFSGPPYCYTGGWHRTIFVHWLFSSEDGDYLVYLTHETSISINWAKLFGMDPSPQPRQYTNTLKKI